MNEKIKSLSIIFPYYKQPEMLKYQLDIWNSYNDDRIEVILVDDGSSIGERAEQVLQTAQKPKNFQLFRILVDLPWNHAGARNIGAKYSKCDWILLMDLDHVFKKEDLETLLSMDLDKNKIYSFQRKYLTTERITHPHVETRLLTKEMYLSIGGYDECFSGLYGGSSDAFVKKVSQKLCEQLPIFLNLVGHKDISDARCALDRKYDDNLKETDRKFTTKNLIKKWKLDNNIGNVNFRFPWVKIF